THILAMNGAVLTALLVVALFSLPWLNDRNPLVPIEARRVVDPGEPSGAATFLETHGGCSRVFAPEWWSSYLNWRLGPRCRTFIDVPVEVFESRTIEDFLVIHAGGDGWSDLLDRHQVDTLVLHRFREAKLVAGGLQSGRWREACGAEL